MSKKSRGKKREEDKRQALSARSKVFGGQKKGENSSNDSVSLLYLIILLVLIGFLVYLLKK
jgi:hypothetical protein